MKTYQQQYQYQYQWTVTYRGLVTDVYGSSITDVAQRYPNAQSIAMTAGQLALLDAIKANAATGRNQ